MHLPTATRAGTFAEPCFNLCHDAGLDLDPWQRWLIEWTLSYDPIGRWVARDIAIIVSRQNGKGSYLEARALFALFLQPGIQLIIWTAHEVNTALEGYKRLRLLIEHTPFLHKQVKRYIDTNGKEGIELRNGRRILFKARSKGSGRGFTCDVLILDEAMIFSADAAAAMLPTLSAVPNPQVIYTGSAGWDESIQFGRMRTAGLKKKPERLLVAEWSIELCNRNCAPECPDHLDPYSKEAARLTNPGLGIRVSWESIQSDQLSMDIDKYKIERLGIGAWPTEDEAWAVIDELSWLDAALDYTPSYDPKTVSFAVDITPDRSWATISVAFRTMDGKIHTEVTKSSIKGLDHRQGTNWLIPRLVELATRHNAPVIIDPATQALSLEEELVALGVEVIRANTRDYGEACQTYLSMICPAREDVQLLSHPGQGLLTSAVACAGKREVGEFWMWDRGESSNLITPVVSSTLAVWGVFQPRKPKAAPPFAFRVKPNRRSA